ncbi:MAG: DNA polymerase I [Patescibacteria group bacterium]
MKIVLIDTFALIHRAYHALPDFRTKAGEPSGAVYGFCSMFLKMVQELQPDGVVAAFDLPGKTFRHQLFSDYQSHRPEKKPDFKVQIEKIKEFLSLTEIPVVSKPGYEGDDIIGSLAGIFGKDKNKEIIILTGDNDSLQLVKPRVKVLTLKKGITETVVYDEKAVFEKFGFEPKLIPDYKALAGDSSDNIPGVPGIGPKTATQLIREFSGIENLIKAAKQNKLKPILTEKILNNAEQLRLAKDLATIRTDLEIKPDSFSFNPKALYSESALSFFKKMGFVSLLKRIRDSFGIDSLDFTSQTKQPSSDLAEADFDSVLKAIKNQKRAFIVFGGKSESTISDGSSFSFVKNAELKEILTDKDLEKIVFDLKSELRNQNNQKLIEILTGNKIWDIKIISWLVDPEFKSYQIERLARRFLGLSWQEKEINPKEKMTFEINSLVKLFEKLIEVLRRENLEKLYLEIEMPLILVLSKMEKNGILLDQKALEKTEKIFQFKLADLEKQIFQLTDKSFNLNSPKELSGVLYDKLGLPVGKIKKLKSGYYSTDSETLEKLKSQHRIINLILDWREIAKLQNTYVKALPKFIDKKDQKIHTIFLQTGTATGRLASESPNLQNIPKHVELAQEIRKLFVSSKGFSLASFDYSQIELRLAANLSGDEILKKAFSSGQDIHKLTAALVWDIPLEKVSSLDRFRAKALNFGVLYGMGARALSQTAKVSQTEAKEFIKNYFDNFAGLKKYIDETLDFLKANGYVQTRFGRKRHFPEFFSGKIQLVGQAERMALNLTIQGLAADIIKKAMIKIDQELAENQLNNQVRMILQIHDELLFEIKDEIIDKASVQIKKIMEQVYPAEVPLKVQFNQGKNWAEID